MKNFLLVAPLILLTLSACAQQSGYSQYQQGEVGISSIADYGTIVAARKIGITGKNSGAGGLAGGTLGAATGANMGGGNGQLVGMVGGAIVGAVAGAATEQAMADHVGIEYTVVKQNGDTITVAQNQNVGDPILAVGSRVIIQTSGSYQRVLSATSLPEKMKRPKGVKFTD